MNAINQQQIRDHLKEFDFKRLFVEQLGWENASATNEVTIKGETYTLESVSKTKGVVVYHCQPTDEGNVPDYQTRRQIERKVTKELAYEHLILFTNADQSTQIWQWVARQKGKPAACREHSYHPGHQDGEALIQKLNHIHIPLSEFEAIDITGAVHKLKDAFDKDKVTKKFYDRFKKEHTAFLKFIEGIDETADREWYASLMLNRLMFSYFIQAKGFLDGDKKYLQNRMQKVQEIKGKDKFQTFYRYFILTLFHEGFGKQKEDRDLDPELTELLGDVRYLNGGLFELHQLEQAYPDIDIPDKAFEKLFAFFDSYDWVLDTRPISDQKEINPDVLGYIFEKYINQKQMGAYYTKEDITDYISKNTIIPFLFDAAKKDCKVAFQKGAPLWALLSENPDAYIYPAVRHGVIDDKGEEIPLPKKIAAGIKDVKKRGDWNKAAAAKFALPTETWREHVARRQRCLEIREKLLAGEVTEINDLITYNLDIRQFAEDAIRECEGSDLLRSFWNAIRKVTVLDPTCGSGAFLFAALDILKSLYETCLDRMHGFIDDTSRAGESPKKFKLFRETLNEIDQHPNLDYFILKSIIVNNLYGVDIMEEAVEICKLRMFLKLVSEIDNVSELRPLPDIDFNVRSGNTLVGYRSISEIEESIAGTLGFQSDEVTEIVEEAEVCEKAFQRFQEMQTSHGFLALEFTDCKSELRDRLHQLDYKLDKYLAGEFVDPNKDFTTWKSACEPFHWCIHFFGIISRGGFDCIIGNPPYVSSSKVKKSYNVLDMRTQKCPDIYAWCMERFSLLLNNRGRMGVIVPLSLTFSRDFQSLRTALHETFKCNWYSSFGRIPAALFSHDVRVRNTIHLGQMGKGKKRNYTSRLHRWFDQERKVLLERLSYCVFSPEIWDSFIPKLDSQLLTSELEKCLAKEKRLSDFVTNAKSSRSSLYFKKTAYNWLAFSKSPPPAFDDNGDPIEQSQLDVICFDGNVSQDDMFLALNGKFCFLFWFLAGDDFHVTKRTLFELPIPKKITSVFSKKQKDELAARLCTKMENSVSFKLNAGKRLGNFNLALCRNVTDEIDAALVKKMGLEDCWDDIELLYTQAVRTNFEDGNETD